MEKHNHHKLQLLSKGFLVSAKKPFLGASLDNVRKCQCSTDCPDVAVEYKCPWKHQDKHPKDAFLTPQIGGVVIDNSLTLSTSSPYYFQAQAQLYVAELSQCDLVVWTKQGIYTHCIGFNAAFMKDVCHKLEVFWLTNVLPVMMASVTPSTSADGVYSFLF